MNTFELGKYGGIPFIKGGKGPKKVVFFSGSHGARRDLTKSAKILQGFYHKLLPNGYTYWIFGYPSKKLAKNSFFEIADSFNDIISKHIGKASVVAISFGGFCAIPFSIRHHKNIDKLLLINTGYRLSHGGAQIVKGMIKAMDRDDFDQVTDQLGWKLCKRRRWKLAIKILNSSNREYKESLIRSKSQKAAIKNVFKRTYLDKKGLNKIKLDLVKIKAPTLIIGSDYDQFFSINTCKEMSKLIPKTKSYFLKNETHTSLFERRLFYRRKIKNFLLT